MIQPIGDLILVEPIEDPRVTESGLYIPDIAQGTPLHGKVLAVGPGRKNNWGEHVPVDVEVGDEVHWQHYAGTEVRDEEFRNLLLIREEHILVKSVAV